MVKSKSTPLAPQVNLWSSEINNIDPQTTKILFVKLHKSAGTTIRVAISHSGLKLINKGHLQLSRYSIDEHTFVVGNIRNPYSQYVSLWAYGCRRRGALYNRITKKYKDKSYLYESYKNIENFQEWLKLVLSPEICRDESIGYYTQRFFRIYDELDKVDMFIRCENIANDLP